MIDFLKKVNIHDNTITKIKNQYNDSTLFDLSCNAENCLKIINYLKELGVTNINELLINELDIFKLNYEELVKRFGKFNIPLLVSLINDDYIAIEHIFDIE